jgi:diguanylate cyclase (GGDEF)-like protein
MVQERLTAWLRPARADRARIGAALVLAVVLQCLTGLGLVLAGFDLAPADALLALPSLLPLVVFARSAPAAEAEAEPLIDEMTGLLSADALARRFGEVAVQATRTGDPVSLLVGDVDRLQRINREHGRLRGDAVLCGIAGALRSELRSYELVYRFGGERFVVLLAGASRIDADEIAERLRVAVERSHPGGLPVTLSLGAATATDGRLDFAELYGAAGSALVTAKQGGRNRVAAASALGARRLTVA